MLAEFHALVVNRRGSHAALRAVDSILDGTTMVVRASEANQERAMMFLRTYEDKGCSMVDAVSFAIMEQMKITAAVTYVRHFVQHGFETIGLDQ